MKKFLLIFAAFVLTLTLAGCKPEDTTDPDPDPDPDPEVCENDAALGTLYNFDENQTEAVTIKVWLDDQTYAEELIAAFNVQYPDINVVWEEVGAVDTRQRLELYAGSDYAADVVVFPHDHIGAALTSNLLYPFPDAQRTDVQTRMIGSAVETATSCYDPANNTAVACDGNFDSELFGAPLSGESVALFYNKTLLNELNGSPDAEGTWEEIIANAMIHNTVGDETTDAFSYFRLDVGNAYDMHFAGTAFGFDLFGENHLDKTMANLDSVEMVNALTWLNEDLRPALNNYNSSTLDGESNRTAFENGELPYIIDGPWSISRYKEASVDEDDNVLFEWGVTKIPTIGGVQPVTFSGVQIAAVYKGTNEATAAFTFVEFMTSDEGLAIMYAATNKLPALKDVSTVAGVAADEYLSGISAQLAFSHPMPIIPEMGNFWSNAGTMYSSAWNGTATPQEAADTAQEGFDSQVGLGS
mgnify:CR=1 FL=1